MLTGGGLEAKTKHHLLRMQVNIYFFLFAECIVKFITLNGQNVDGGISMMCPSKCAQQTTIPKGDVHNLPKNFSVLDIVHSTRERSSSLVMTRPRTTSLSSATSLPPTTTGEYNCDVCETSGAVVVCSSCAVLLCQLCSDDIHSRKGYQVHVLTPVAEFMASLETIVSDTQLTSEVEYSDEHKVCKSHPGEPLECYCEMCCEQVCRLCRVSGEHKEHAHECRPVADVASEKRAVLRRMADSMCQCQAEWNKGFDDCHEWREHLFAKRRHLESVIQSHFHSVHSALHAREESTLSVVRSEIEARSQLLKSQAE